MCVQVAELMLRGMEEGRYTVRFPDTMATCITSALAGTAPLSLPLWVTVPLAPVVVGLRLFMLCSTSCRC